MVIRSRAFSRYSRAGPSSRRIPPGIRIPSRRRFRNENDPLDRTTFRDNVAVVRFGIQCAKRHAASPESNRALIHEILAYTYDHHLGHVPDYPNSNVPLISKNSAGEWIINKPPGK